MHETIAKRLFVGGLSSEVTAEEVIDRFSRFGKVSNLSLKTRTDEAGNKVKSFAHLDLEAEEANIKKCFSTYQNAKWKGSVLQIQYAKESFLQKLEKEREEALNKKEDVPEIKPSHIAQPQLFEVKGPAVPGTPVTGKKDWIVGKYGRVLPILKLKKSYKIKMVKYDPSKHCHAAKVFKDDKSSNPADTSCNKLTWEINTPDTEITKKRKGEFPQTSISAKKIKKAVLSPSEYFSRKVEEVEVVKVGSGNVKAAAKLVESNRFDSDLESDSEVDSLSKNVSNRLQVGKNNWLHGPTPGPKTLRENNENVRLKGNENRGNNKIVSKLASKDKTLSVSGSKNSPIPLGTNVKVVKGAEPNTFPTLQHSLKKEYSPSAFKKIPEFKGLGMLGHIEECSRTGRESLGPSTNDYLSVDRSEATIANGTVDGSTSSQSVSEKSTFVRSLGVLNVQSCVSDVGSNSSANTTAISTSNFKQKISKLKEQQKQSSQKFSELLPAENKLPSTSVLLNELPDILRDDSALKNYDSSSSADTDEIIARCKRKKGMSSSTVIKSELTSENSAVLNNLRKYDNSPEEIKQSMSPFLLSDIPDVLGDDTALTNYDSSSSADTDEIIARCKRRKGMVPSDDLVAKKSSAGFGISNRLRKCELLQKENKQANSLVLPNDMPDILRDDSVLKSYDSSSSAGTDEIIARCKRRKGMVPSVETVSKTLSGKSSLTNSDRKNELGARVGLNSKSFVDTTLSLSEFVAGTSEHPADSVPASGLLKHEDYDSDLDSNDFALVVRKLTEKSASPKINAAFNNKQRDSKNDNRSPATLLESSQKTRGHTKVNITVGSAGAVGDGLPVNCQKPVRNAPSWMKDSCEKVSPDSSFRHKVFNGSEFDSSDDDDDAENDDSEEDYVTEEEDDTDEEEGETDDDEDCKEKSKPSTGVDKRLKEKSGSLRVAQNAVGKTSVARASDKFKNSTVPIIDMNAFRFDPTKIQKQ
ncbi:hypothetical protein BsWGS_11937 [Bradybaena similaris]